MDVAEQLNRTFLNFSFSTLAHLSGANNLSKRFYLEHHFSTRHTLPIGRNFLIENRDRQSITYNNNSLEAAFYLIVYLCRRVKLEGCVQKQ